MSDVKRYWAEMFVGGFYKAHRVVLASDYDALAQRCRELEEAEQKAAFRQQSDESAYSVVVQQNDALAQRCAELERDLATVDADTVAVPRERIDDLALKLYRIDHLPSFCGDSEKRAAVCAALDAARALLGKEGEA